MEINMKKNRKYNRKKKPKAKSSREGNKINKSLVRLTRKKEARYN